MHPGINGPKLKDKPAIIMAGSGDVITHQELIKKKIFCKKIFNSIFRNNYEVFLELF